MANLRLVAPNVELEEKYLEMLEEWQKSGEAMIPFSLKMDSTDFPAFIQQLQSSSQGIGIPAGFVPSSTFWLTNEANQILGAVNLRHRLNEALSLQGGHIGYGIRPSERRKGYATQQLQLALPKARALGIAKVLITCDKSNLGSAKVIRNNGGQLADEVLVERVLIQRYWITI